MSRSSNRWWHGPRGRRSWRRAGGAWRGLGGRHRRSGLGDVGRPRVGRRRVGRAPNGDRRDRRRRLRRAVHGAIGAAPLERVVGAARQRPAALVHVMVVQVAERRAVGEVGGTSVLDPDDVVHLALARRDRAAGERAGRVRHHERAGLGRGEATHAATVVEDVARGVDDHPRDVGVARVSADRLRRDAHVAVGVAATDGGARPGRRIDVVQDVRAVRPADVAPQIRLADADERVAALLGRAAGIVDGVGAVALHADGPLDDRVAVGAEAAIEDPDAVEQLGVVEVVAGVPRRARIHRFVALALDDRLESGQLVGEPLGTVVVGEARQARLVLGESVVGSESLAGRHRELDVTGAHQPCEVERREHRQVAQVARTSHDAARVAPRRVGVLGDPRGRAAPAFEVVLEGAVELTDLDREQRIDARRELGELAHATAMVGRAHVGQTVDHRVREGDEAHRRRARRRRRSHRRSSARPLRAPRRSPCLDAIRTSLRQQGNS